MSVHVPWRDVAAGRHADELLALLWPASKVTATTAPVRVHTSKYVDVALEREVADVSSATEGTRNDQLNRSAVAALVLLRRARAVGDEMKWMDELTRHPFAAY
jgi:hypothetical protein